MRVLVVTTAGTGHILPTLPVADALRRAGHDVVWATAPESHGVVRRHGFAVRAVGMGLPERQARFAAEYGHALTLPPPERRPVMFTGLFASIAAPRAADDLEPVLDDFTPDLLVHEVAELASGPLATARGVPRVTVAFSGAIPEPVLSAAVEGARPLWSRVGLDVPPDLGLHDRAYVHPFAPVLGQRPDHPAVVDAAPGTPTYEDADPLGDLGRDRPLAYVTFGTEMGALAPWGPVLDGLSAAGLDVLATVGAMDPAAVPRPDDPGPGRLRVERYVPQHAVLGRARLVVSHGGAGTVIAAGAAGIPQLMIPLGADQFDNAAAFAGAGVARILTPATNRDEVLRTVAELLDDETVRSCTQRLRAEYRAMPLVSDALASVL